MSDQAKRVVCDDQSVCDSVGYGHDVLGSKQVVFKIQGIEYWCSPDEAKKFAGLLLATAKFIETIGEYPERSEDE